MEGWVTQNSLTVKLLLTSFEGPDGRGLSCAYLASLDVRYKKVLATGGTTGEAAQHGQLAYVGERIGYGALEKTFGRSAQRRIGGQKGVQGLERLEEAALFLGPGARLGGLPALLPNGRAQRPVEEVAHVGQNLHGQAAGGVKTGKVIGSAFQGSGGPVGNGGQRVAQQFAFLVHTRNYSAFFCGRWAFELGNTR